MNRDDIIRMALEAGMEVHERKQQARIGMDALLGVDSTDKLERFATLVVSPLQEKINDLELAEEGAKEAFGHVVQQKRDLEAECKRLRKLLDGAYGMIRTRRRGGCFRRHPPVHPSN